MHALAISLGVRLYSAVGIMEMLWHYAGQHTPEGDIGSVPDSEIAGAVSWEKRPAKLIHGLVSSGWLDPHEEYRFVIHDWPDHCEQSVRKWLFRNRKRFLPVYGHVVDDVRTDDGQMTDAVPSSRGLGLAVCSSEVNSSNGNFSAQNAFPKLVELWEKPCEHCGMCFRCTQKELGFAAWSRLIEKGRITDENYMEVFEGLERFRISQEWHKSDGKYVMAMSTFLGWAANGMPAAPRWPDTPQREEF